MSDNQKVLLVSPYPYSISSRGIDVLTNCFEEEGWSVHHLTFPRVFYTPGVTPPKDSLVKSILAKKVILPYIDRIMYWFPRVLFTILKNISNFTVRKMDFNNYDYIVLESGKPLFLMDIIPKNIPIIYRLSDSVQLVLGKNPHYQDLEKKVFQHSYKMIFKKEIYKSFLNEDQKKKTTVIENGMIIPKVISPIKPYITGSKNAVYVGLHQLDFPTVKALVSQNPFCHFHIIGPCLGKKQVKKMNFFDNFHFYPFLSKEEYMPLLKEATMAIFPFKRTEAMKWFGLTSKLLHFMYFKLPIVLYPTGVEGEFENLPVRFAKSPNDFVSEVKKVLLTEEKIDYNLDFEFYSNESRKNEYKSFIRNL